MSESIKKELRLKELEAAKEAVLKTNDVILSQIFDALFGEELLCLQNGGHYNQTDWKKYREIRGFKIQDPKYIFDLVSSGTDLLPIANVMLEDKVEVTATTNSKTENMKQALCVARHDVVALIKERYYALPIADALRVYNPEQPLRILKPMPYEFLEVCETSLLNREWCETNPTYLQLLPYIVLLSEDGIFMYRRGKGGKEDRLHDLYSIGVGGHIEEISVELPGIENTECDQNNNVVIDRTTCVVVADTIRREIQEEVGIIMTDDEFATLVTHINGLWFLYSDKDQVGSVHLGLTIGMIFSKHRFGQSEDNVITDGQFVTVEEIKEGGYKLEQWSQLLVRLFDKSINEEVPDETQFPFFSFSELYRPIDTVNDVNVVYPKQTTDAEDGVVPGSEDADDNIARGSDLDQV